MLDSKHVPCFTDAMLLSELALTFHQAPSLRWCAVCDAYVPTVIISSVPVCGRCADEARAVESRKPARRTRKAKETK